jgi:hypothetical protein
MSNHFHVLLAVPKRPEVLPTAEAERDSCEDWKIRRRGDCNACGISVDVLR